MATPGGLVDKQELIDAQLDTAHLGRVVNSKDASGAPISESTNRTGGVNKTLDAIEAELDQTITDFETEATQTITDVNVAFDAQREGFEATFSSQFAYNRIGNISTYVGDTLLEADKLNAYQYPDNSGEWYGPIQGQTFPITIPANPSTDNGWALVNNQPKYKGLWPDTGGEAFKGDTFQTQVGGTPTGQYFEALQDTLVDPMGDNVNWREIVSASTTSKIYKASPGGSAVDNMVAEIPIGISIGDICSTGGTSWLKVSNSFPTTIANFFAISDSDERDFNSINDALEKTNSSSIRQSISDQSEVNLPYSSRLLSGNQAEISVPTGKSFIEPTTADDFKYALLHGQRASGQGKTEDGTKFIDYKGEYNHIFNTLIGLRLSGFDTCIEYSGGWGNTSIGVDHRGSINGVKHTTASFQPGWTGSGNTSIGCSYQYNNVGVNDVGTPWLNTFINPIFEGNDTGLIHRGHQTVLANPWFEANTKNMEIYRGLLVFGGRDVSWSADDVSIFNDWEIIQHMDNGGLLATRGGSDTDDSIFHYTGKGVKRIQGGLSTANITTDTLNIGSSSFTSPGDAEGINISHNSAYSLARLGDVYDKANKSRVVDISIGATKSSSGTGAAIGDVSFKVSKFESDGSASNAESTPLKLSLNELGTGEDGINDIGSAGARFNDLFLVNSPTVGSDEHIKNTPRAISDELCQLALDVENQGYTLKVNQSGREHFGIVITDKLRDSLSKVVDLNKFAPLCKTEFTDDDGNTLYKNLWGDKVVIAPVVHGDKLVYEIPENSECIVDGVSSNKPVVEIDIPELDKGDEWSGPKVYAITGGVRLSEFWQVRYQEWQCIVNEALRRENRAIKMEINLIKNHLGI